MRIAWLGNLFTGASSSLAMPLMALYVEQLGALKNRVERYVGLAVSLLASTLALIAPVWRRLVDRHGHKPMMVGVSLVMTFTMGGLAFIPNVFQLLALYILNDSFSSYVPNSIASIANQTSRNRSGYVPGALATDVIGGSLVGLLLGGAFAEISDIRQVFLLVSFILLTCSLMIAFLVKEDFQPVAKAEALSARELFSSIKDKQTLIGLFVINTIIQVPAQSTASILTLYIRHSDQTENLMFVSGLIVSALGFSSILLNSALRKISSRIGNHRLLSIALFHSFSMYALRAPVQNPLQPGIVRFLYGLGTGMLTPSISSLLVKIIPCEGVSCIFNYNQMFINMGQIIGPFIGPTVTTGLGHRSIFYAASLIVFVSFVWNLINFGKYLKVKETM